MRDFPCVSTWFAATLVIVVFLGSLAEVQAGAHRFTYVYEATTSASGSFEFETWGTWKTSPHEDRRFNAVDFRHEIEFGITDRLQAAVYVADWGYREDANDFYRRAH